MVQAILGVLGVMTIWFGTLFVKDFAAHKDELEDNSWGITLAIGFVTNFFDALGIGSFATVTAALKLFKQTKDRIIPGTLNVGLAIPVVVEAFIFIAVIDVEIVTLVCMLASATAGAYLGAGIVSKFDERKIQLIMGFALLATAFLMTSGQMGWTASLGTGEAIGLTGAKLIIAVVANFVLGALMTAGVGMYAPCMALVYMLGMSPRVAFPIMMGSSAFLMPIASIKFIKEGAYDRKAAMALTIAGVAGLLIAAYIVKTLPLNILSWVVIGVVLYTSATMLRSASKNKKAAKNAA